MDLTGVSATAFDLRESLADFELQTDFSGWSLHASTKHALGSLAERISFRIFYDCQAAGGGTEAARMWQRISPLHEWPEECSS